MRYWEEMNDKNGFGDGDSVPPDAHACREAYVRVINGLAEKRGSQRRIVAYDRPGMHNWCLVVMVDMEQFPRCPVTADGLPLTGDLDEVLGHGQDEAEPDGVMAEIVSEMVESSLPDKAVAVSAVVDKGVVVDIIRAVG